MSQPMIWVDDTDEGISYTGPWFEKQNMFTDIGNFGPPFQQTLHGVTTNASLTYAFSGTDVEVSGTLQLQKDASGTLDPSWSCTVDGAIIPNYAPSLPVASNVSENNYPLCTTSGLSAGSHTVKVVVTVLRNQAFWFDSIQYTPTSDVSYTGKMVYIPDTFSNIVYVGRWQVDSVVHSTQTVGATMSLTFNGTQLSWYGIIPADGEFASAPSQATYSIDGGTPTSFLVKGPASDIINYNQTLFQTSTLSDGQHTIVVTHQGNGNQTPLTLDNLVLTVGKTTSSGPLTVPNPSTTSKPSTSSSSSTETSSGGLNASSSVISTGTHPSSSNTGAIIGGVIGGLALIVALVLGVLFLQRRRRAEVLFEEYKGQTEPSRRVHTSAPSTVFGHSTSDPSDPDLKKYDEQEFRQPAGVRVSEVTVTDFVPLQNPVPLYGSAGIT